MKTYYKPEQITAEICFLEHENIYFIHQFRHNLISLQLLRYINLIEILNISYEDFKLYRVFNMGYLLGLDIKMKYFK